MKVNDSSCMTQSMTKHLHLATTSVIQWSSWARRLNVHQVWPYVIKYNQCYQVWLPRAPSMCVFSSILVEKKNSEHTDNLHEPNFRGIPSLAIISYVRDLTTRTHRQCSMVEITAYTVLWWYYPHKDLIIQIILLLAESPGLSPSEYCITKS